MKYPKQLIEFYPLNTVLTFRAKIAVLVISYKNFKRVPPGKLYIALSFSIAND